MPNTGLGGVRWAKTRRGANNQPVEEMPVLSGYATGIFRGDPLKKASDGTVQVAAAGDAVYAICNGIKQYKAAGVVQPGGNFLPASTTYTGAPVKSNPQASIVSCTPVMGQVFEVDMNASVASLTAAQSLVGNNIDLAAGAGGSTTTGRSTYVGDVATAGTATAQARITDIPDSPDNDVTAANWKAHVEFNEGTEPSASTATGI